MNAWDTQWLERVTDNNMDFITGIRYMDDIHCFMYAIREDWRWLEGSLCFCEEWRKEDMEAGKSGTERTARVLVDLMNSIEIWSDFADLKLPTWQWQ